MKTHLPSLLFGCLGVVMGFALCYACFVWPERPHQPMAPPKQVVAEQKGNKDLDWHPLKVQPVLPPKVTGR